MNHNFQVGQTYIIRGTKGELLERKVVEIGKQYLTYLRRGVPTKCQISTFKKVYEEHGVRGNEG